MYSPTEMNTTTTAIKAAICRPQSYGFLLKTAFFHSTPVLERKRRSSESDGLFTTCKSNAQKKKRSKKFLREHQEAVRRAVEQLKQEREEAIKKAKEEREAKEKQKGKHGSESWCKRRSDSYDDDFDYILRNIFTQSSHYYNSTYRAKERHWSWSSYYSSNSWRSKYKFYEGGGEEEEEEEEEEEQDDGYSSSKSSGSVSESIQFQACHRQTLGLSPWGPLKLEDVKNAYRTCALKWHPDRHEESTKAAAEEKFKLCNVAYHSLLEKLAVK